MNIAGIECQAPVGPSPRDLDRWIKSREGSRPGAVFVYAPGGGGNRSTFTMARALMDKGLVRLHVRRLPGSAGSENIAVRRSVAAGTK